MTVKQDFEQPEIQKFNHETQQWESYQPPSSWRYLYDEINESLFIPRIINGQINPNSRPPEVSEDGRYVVDKEKSFFNVGDMIEDNMKTNSMGVGFIVEKELFDGPTPYTYTDKTDGKKKTAERVICGWKYLVEFPDPSKKGIARKGELWMWEAPMRELLDDGLLIHHRVKKNGQ